MKPKIFVFLNLALVLMALFASLTLFIASPLQAQLNLTEQQQTIDAAVQQFFNATATAQQATAAAGINPATQTAIFEQTLMAAFQQAQTATAQALILPAATQTPMPTATLMATEAPNPILNVQPDSVAQGQALTIRGNNLVPNVHYTVILTHKLTSKVFHTTAVETDAEGRFTLSITIGRADLIGNYILQIRRLGALVIEKEFRVVGSGNITITTGTLTFPPTATRSPEPRPGRILAEGLRTLAGQGSAFDFTGWKRDVRVGYKKVDVIDKFNYIQWIYASDKVYRNFILAAEVQFNNSPQDGACGFVYYDNARFNNRYDIALDRNFIFSWEMQRNGDWFTPDYVFTPENTGVYGGARESNEWVILSDNGQGVILVNGGMIAYMVFSDLLSGKVAMAASTSGGNARNSCIFRDVEIWVPG